MKKRKKQNLWCKINGGIKMAKMTGLGKGLDALFGAPPEE